MSIPEAEKTRKKVRPIIKWTGGKYDEFSIFFASQPQTPAYLNDKSRDLIRFYSLIHSRDFSNELNVYSNVWDQAGKLSDELKPVLLPLFKKFTSNEVDLSILKISIKKIIDRISGDGKWILFKDSFIIYPEKFIKKLEGSIVDKCKRIKDISNNRNRNFSDNELKDHIETGIKSGLYLFLRELMNLEYSGKVNMSEARAIANWHFVREFCYASMFRYNSKGASNIPYGGIAYNKKNFRAKVENIFSVNIQDLFRKANFYNLDFAQFLIETKPGKMILFF